MTGELSLSKTVSALHQVPVSFLGEVKLEYIKDTLVFKWRHVTLKVATERIADIRVHHALLNHTLWFAYQEQNELRWVGLARTTPIFNPQTFLKKVIGKDFERIQKQWYWVSFKEDREVTVGSVPKPSVEALKQVVRRELPVGEDIAAVSTSEFGGLVLTTDHLFLVEVLPGQKAGVLHRSRLQPLNFAGLRGVHLHQNVLTLTVDREAGPEKVAVYCCDAQTGELVKALKKKRHQHRTRWWNMFAAASPRDLLEHLTITLLLTAAMVCAPAYPREVLYEVAVVCGGAFLIGLLESWPMLLMVAVIAVIGKFVPPLLGVLAILGVWGLMGRLQFVLEHYWAVLMSVPYFVWLGLLIYLNWHHPGALDWSYQVVGWGILAFVVSGGMVVVMNEGTGRSRWHDLYMFILTPSVIISLLIPLLGKAMHAASIHQAHAPHLPGSHGHAAGGVHTGHMHTVSAHIRHTAHGPVLVREHLAADPYTKDT
ncbi:hypothetical protein [Deinococcus cellulosilyticus]|uniref:Uncharacterized protein n=1 Tax=Deinococcus cellulosilyticus (strain DSM 18568 / NBRC 106333 / KACC 11606 / 5516J-15) TaxID=1223518 RepID=A0A511NB03_DEIC1|nr:hypothetical protein [Deinococcus cellulosilyticus]GEM49767.1 hypothetical protein DC3_54020 [Deinococcus cellulosilyticus NBRC 106333 = KACC 11606]